MVQSFRRQYAVFMSVAGAGWPVSGIHSPLFFKKTFLTRLIVEHYYKILLNENRGWKNGEIPGRVATLYMQYEWNVINKFTLLEKGVIRRKKLFNLN